MSLCDYCWNHYPGTQLFFTSQCNFLKSREVFHRRVPSCQKYCLEICVLSKSYFLFEISSWHFVCVRAQSHDLCTRTKFQPEILTINVISDKVYFREIMSGSPLNVCETLPGTFTNHLRITDIKMSHRDLTQLCIRLSSSGKPPTLNVIMWLEYYIKLLDWQFNASLVLPEVIITADFVYDECTINVVYIWHNHNMCRLQTCPGWYK